MTRTTATAALILLIGIAGCASNPQALRRDAYDAYWACASHAVRPYVERRDLGAREAAMRAQAQCNASYRRYRAAQIAVVADVVDADSADMARGFGAQEALAWRRRVTSALTDYVRRARSGA